MNFRQELIRQIDDQDHFDMEPFRLLRDWSRSERDPAIGGPVQMVKFYPYSNYLPFAVFWPDRKQGIPTFWGRPLLGYESFDTMAVDPDTLEVVQLRDAFSRTWDDGKA